MDEKGLDLECRLRVHVVTVPKKVKKEKKKTEVILKTTIQ